MEQVKNLERKVEELSKTVTDSIIKQTEQNARLSTHLENIVTSQNTISTDIKEIKSELNRIDDIKANKADLKDLASLNRVEAIEKSIKNFATTSRVTMIERVVYGAVALILTTVGAALIALIIK